MGEGNQKVAYIVDDEADVGRAIKRFLQSRYRDRIRFELFRWGSEALLAFQTERPDILITDLQSPEMWGDEIIAEMRRVTPELPVILISGNDDALIAIAPTLTNARCLAKPVGIDDLLKAIDELLAPVALP